VTFSTTPPTHCAKPRIFNDAVRIASLHHAYSLGEAQQFSVFPHYFLVIIINFLHLKSTSGISEQEEVTFVSAQKL
jgi:hypothetical protein